MQTRPGCPSDDDIACLVEGTLSPDEQIRIQRHIDHCETCRTLVADAAAARLRDRTTHNNPDSLSGTRTPPLKKGTPVGRYVVLEYLGAGGMATVYAAFDPVLDRRVALKILNREAHARQGPDFLLREARLVAQFAHPNVITVHDTGTFGDQVFLAMELVEGGTLRDWLMQPRTTTQIVTVLLQAGRGLAAAHGAGLAHRDFKPDNVLIGTDGRARVTDFGLAGPTGHASSSAGTPAYMAPEQMSGEAADARVDIFSFCVTLYEALYGQRPFAGDTLSLLSTEIAGGRVREPPRDRRVAPALHRLIVQGLAADPEARPPSLSWLLDRLVVDSRRRRLIWTVGALVLLAAAAGIVGERIMAWRASSCSGAAQLVEGVWNAAQREKIRAAFLATGASYAATSFQSVSAALDGYVRAWTTTRVAACEATRVERTQPEAAWGLAANCLDQRRRALAGLVDILLHADAQVVQHAVTAVDNLADVTSCRITGEGAFEAQVQPAARARFDEAIDKVDRAQTLSLLDKDSEARPLAEAGLAQVRALGVANAEAYAETVLAGIEQRQSDSVAALATAWSAFEHAQRARDDRQVIQALKGLVGLEGLTNPTLALRLSNIALATVARFGNRSSDIIDIKRNRSGALVALNRTDQAIAEMREVLTDAEQKEGPHSTFSFEAHGNIAVALCGQGRFQEGAKEIADSLAGLERGFGAAHPDTLIARNNLGYVLLMLGRLDEATPMLERSARDDRATFGPSSDLYATAVINLGELRLARGNFTEAASLEREAIAILQKAAADSPALIEPLTELGLAESGVGHTDEAIARIERALGLAASSSPTDRARVQLSLAKVLSAAHRDPTRVKKLAREAQTAWLNAAKKWGGENPRFAAECAPYL